MALLPPAAELVPFDEVAAILADAVARSTGGPPALLPIPGRYLAAALELAGCQVVRSPRPGRQLTLQVAGVGHNTSTEKRRTTLMRMPLGDLATWHLLLKCPACRDDRYVDLGMLIQRYGTQHTLIEIVPRLRCRFRACQKPPETVRLRNRYPVQQGPALIDVVLKGPGAF